MLFFFFIIIFGINGGGIVEHNGSTFAVGLSFFGSGLWDLPKRLRIYHLYSCKARNCVSASQG